MALSMNQGTPVTAPGVSFEVQSKISGQKLEVRYRLRNQRKRALLVFNVLWDEDPAGNVVPSPSPFYACVRDPASLHLAQKILPLPQSKRLEVRIVPFVTRIEPGAIMESSFALALPVEEYNPYFPVSDETTTKLVTTEVLFVTLQFIEELDGMELTEAPIERALHAYHPEMLAKVEATQSPPLKLQLAVRKRLDEFERF